MLEFSETVPEVDARRIVRQAIFKAAEKGSVTARSPLAQINRLEREYSECLPERYVLLTSLSLSQFASLPRCKFGNTVIIFEPNPPLHYQGAALDLTARAKHTLFADLPTDYLSVRVHVSARSEFRAADLAPETAHRDQIA